jgi:hypothetical protein
VLHNVLRLPTGLLGGRRSISMSHFGTLMGHFQIDDTLVWFLPALHGGCYFSAYSNCPTVVQRPRVTTFFKSSSVKL